ncbi:MAG: ParB/RepB/Spo0J family partition protein [Rectinemataceae bacterium]|jgi:ParB family chromosome partitioning protein
MAKQFGLGKGLGALIPDSEFEDTAHGGAAAEGVCTLPLSRLKANPDQPRRTFSEESLAELANSLKTHGLIQPILVEETSEGYYLIVAGERRFRAAAMAGLSEVPVIVRSYTPEKRLEIALIENVQREDLNPVEEAEAYRSLMAIGSRSQEEVADVVGKSRSAVANSIRLLRLPESFLAALREGTLSAGHAKALLSVVDPAMRDILFARVIAEGISVRETEAAAQMYNTPRITPPKKAQRPERPKEPEIREVEERLIEALGTKVSVKGDGKKGTIAIEYYSLEDLERILDVLAR